MESALLHPAAILLIWIVAVGAIQFLTGVWLFALGALVAVFGSSVLARWWRLVRRARWLLFSLWLILAYGTPGEVWHDLSWAPSEAGLIEASLHAARLIVMLGALAVLFERLPRPELMSGLWALLRRGRRLGFDADRLVVRLTLVFDYLDRSPPRGSWRHVLDEAEDAAPGTDRVSIELPAWRIRDVACIAAAALLFGLAIWMS